MNRRPHLRNALITLLFMASLLGLVAWQRPATAAPPQAPAQAPLQQGLDFTFTTGSITLSTVAGSQVQAQNIILRNNGAARTFLIESTLPSTPAGWQLLISPGTSVFLNSNQQQAFTFIVVVPANTPLGTYNVTVTAREDGTTSPTANFIITVNVVSPSPTPTNTVGPATVTPTRGPVCTDGFEPDNNPASARVIDVNTAQERAICPSGDEDWLVFGGVAGKVYTIDVSRMDPGIDLTLELFDENLNSIAFNDDFFNRDPANPNPGDIRPRITIRIPADGRYYVKIRDAAGRGGQDYIYVVALLDESYGPTPTTVQQICQDIFEPDGLPEQARLITSNELQEQRRLCPTGDADWVTFFGKADKRYIIYTDTRRYRGPNVVNGETQAGADTVIVLTDRDGVSIIDINDDIPGGSTLDSQIEFTPEVDGFYFLQIKNIGDIGNQFIRYDLVLLLCVPGQTDCGRASIPGVPANPITPLPTGTPADEFELDPTRTPTVAP